MSRNFGIPKRQFDKSNRVGHYRPAQDKIAKRNLFANDNEPKTLLTPTRGMRWFNTFVKRTFGRDQQPRH